MEIQTTARLSALELLTTELLAAHLLTVPDAAFEVSWAIDHLRKVVDVMPVASGTAKEIATLRAAVNDELSRILKAALAKANQAGRQRWDAEIGRETKT